LVFGAALAVSVARFISFGWVERLLSGPSFHFKYWGFEWVEPLPAASLEILFWLMLLAAVTTALGLAFRLSVTFLAAAFSYIQLIDVSTYLNHYYLAALLLWLLALSPAHRVGSVDAWWAKRRGRPFPPRVASAWHYLFRFQVGVVYVFAGLAKAQSDWLVHGQPLSIWLGANTDLPLIGPLLTLPHLAIVLSWCGFLFDSTIVLWLLLRKTRPAAYALVVVFHLLTGLLLPIGMFPFIMMGAALVFFEPDWPRRLARWLRLNAAAFGEKAPGGTAPMPAFRHKALLVLGACYCAAQLLLPLRPLVYGGNSHWHEQGMRFSWRVMVRAKGGTVTFRIKSQRTGEVWHVSPSNYLTRMQELEMSSQPDLIAQLAKHIQHDMQRRGYGTVEVRVDAHASLNGRRSARLIDPAVNLALAGDGLSNKAWVLPAPEQAPPHTRPVL
jgi:hypothetical protein